MRRSRVRKQKVLEEVQLLAVFAIYVVLFPRRKAQSHNSTAHVERAIGAIRGYYQSIHGRIPVKDQLVDYGNLIKRILKRLAKLYSTTNRKRLPLLASHMREIKKVIDLKELEDTTLWSLWLTQWQVVIRGLDILRPVDQNNSMWDIKKDKHIGPIKLEAIDPKMHHSCDMRLRWDMKPTKTEQSGEKDFEKTLLVDNEYDLISAGAAIEQMLNLRGRAEKSDPLFFDYKTGKEVTLATSRKKLAEKFKEAGLSEKFIKGHSLRIGGASAYANSSAAGAATAGFMGFWTSGARWDYMHADEDTLEKAGVAIAREKGGKLATRSGAVSSYAQGSAPN